MGRICCYQIYEIASDKKWVAWKDRYKVLVSSSQICRYKSNTSINISDGSAAKMPLAALEDILNF